MVNYRNQPMAQKKPRPTYNSQMIAILRQHLKNQFKSLYYKIQTHNHTKLK